MASSTPPRRIDRQRRSKIVTAAIKIMEEEGVNALTHRRAARAAEVPLGATTYYFTSIGDLMAAALQEIVNEDLRHFHERMESVSSKEDLAHLLAQFVCESETTEQKSGALTTEFVAASLRHEEVRQVALSWLSAWHEILVPLVGDQAARAAMGATAGLVQQGQMTHKEPSEKDITEIMLRIFDGKP